MNEKKGIFQDINQTILNKVIFNCWESESYNIIEGKDKIKAFYNNCYISFEKELQLELDRFHPAGWILEAYKQLEAWHIIYFNIELEGVLGKKEFAPIGRYGWRYVIEKSLEKLSSKFDYRDLRPDENSMNNVFTILLGMLYSSEYSNYLHFFQDNFQSARLKFSPYILTRFCELNESERIFFDNLKDNLFKKPNWDNYDRFNPSSDEMKARVSEFLSKNFSLTIKELETIVLKTIIHINQVIGASIIVQPLNDFVDLLVEITNLDRAKIISLVDLSFLDVTKPKHAEREFLRKNQQSRMLYNGGVILNLNSNFESIYDKFSAKRQDVIKEEKHILISPWLFSEWLGMFVMTLTLGQREDLRRIDGLRNQVEDIESYYKINLFERGIKSLLEAKGFTCFNLNKIKGKLIDCGEIDVLGFSEKLNLMIIVECKALAAIVDARGIGRVIKDHYKQKKYHQKFLKKIRWCKDNLEDLIKLFEQDKNVNMPNDVNIEPYFVVLSSSPISLIEKKYPILTFNEFDELIDGRLKKI